VCIIVAGARIVKNVTRVDGEVRGASPSSQPPTQPRDGVYTPRRGEKVIPIPGSAPPPTVTVPSARVERTVTRSIVELSVAHVLKVSVIRGVQHRIERLAVNL
jgi:hypothetical protein